MRFVPPRLKFMQMLRLVVLAYKEKENEKY
jgi:hypothetical protein